MPLDRRGILKGIGAASIGGSAIFGSGALTQISSARTVSVDVTNDSQSTLSVSAGTTDGIGNITESDGKLSIDLSDINANSQLLIGDAGGPDPSKTTISKTAFEITDNATYDSFENEEYATGVDVSISSSSSPSSGLGMIFLPTTTKDDLANANAIGGKGYTSSDQNSVIGTGLSAGGSGSELPALPSRYSSSSGSARFLFDQVSTVGAEIILQADAADLNSNPSFDIEITAEPVDISGEALESSDFSITDGMGNTISSTSFGSYDPRASTSKAFVTVANNSPYSVSVTSSNGDVTVQDSNGTTAPSIPSNSSAELELSHSQSTDQTTTLEISSATDTYTEQLDVPAQPSSAIARWTLAPGDRNNGSIADTWSGGYDGASKVHIDGDAYSDLQDTTLTDSTSGNPNYVTDGSTTFGDSEHVAIQNSSLLSELNSTDTETVSLWMRASDTTGGNPALVSSGYTGDSIDIGLSPYYRMGDNGNLRASRFDNGNWVYVDSSSSFDSAKNSWTHICITHDGSSGDATIYVNGTEVASGSLPNTNYNEYLTINNRWDAGDNYIGEFQDVRYYDTVLNSTEVTNLYNTGHI